MSGRYYIEVYGCSLNHADAALAAGMLEAAGYRRVETPWEADVILVFTCTVRLDSEERMTRRIRVLSGVAEKTGATLVVAGCMAAAQPYTVKRIYPKALLLSPANPHRVLECLRRRRSLLHEPARPKTLYTPPPRIAMHGRVAEIPIVDGCLGDCAFCITKLARRRLYSRPLEVVKRYAEELVRSGALELRVTGQDAAAYGVDIYGERLLPRLVEELASIPGDFMIRVGMMSPDQLLPILDELLEAMRSPKVYKFLHVPVQCGDDELLRIMGRKYTVDDVRYIVREARRRLPGVTIATDIIVGHPGEDEEAFRNTLRLLEELRFERVHVAQYTPRPRTRAAAMKQVPDPVKKERSKRVMEIVQRIGFEEHSRLVGARARCLALGPGERGGVEARLYNYVQVILPEGVEPGWVEVEITEATWYDVRARPTLMPLEGS
ncbi:MAG: tRNA (N(6)-L-threonylcarbamoyladenosine(37)-C(2))-methylthiotransferase [Crenarchaeota archaeon]|nr:tRNA (N(6)-L-threonylcarbamoyladenosine(37)-C(2))-methylthiotransferase [Thermoproteota archaeon]